MKLFLRRIFGFFLRASKILSRKGLYGFLERELDRLPEGTKVLNVGAGGEVERKIRMSGRDHEIFSLDIDPARKPDIVGDIISVDLEAGAFDAVVMMEVLEHVEEPRRALANVHRLLAEGGRLILTAPFTFPMHDRPRDYFRFTRYGLELLLCEFVEVEIEPRNSWAEAISVLVARLVMEPHWTCRLVTPFAVTLAFLLLPAVWLLGRTVRTDFLTTGYTVSAVKSSPLGSRS